MDSSAPNPVVQFHRGKWYANVNGGLVGPFVSEQDAQAWIDAVSHASLGLANEAYRTFLAKAADEYPEAEDRFPAAPG